MLEVKQFRYGGDNLGYIVHGPIEAVAIDPGAAEKMHRYIQKNDLFLKKILNTHSHFDHLIGNAKMQNLTGITPVNCKNLTLNESISIGKEKLRVIPTPGHTQDSVCFYCKDRFVITGDTLFIANVGNCTDSFTEVFRNGLQKLLSLGDNVIVYPGHDYTERSLKRASDIEPANMDIQYFKKQYDPHIVSSTIGFEKKINPYLRTDVPAIVKHLEGKGMDTSTAEKRFRSILTLY